MKNEPTIFLQLARADHEFTLHALVLCVLLCGPVEYFQIILTLYVLDIICARLLGRIAVYYLSGLFAFDNLIKFKEFFF